MLACVSVFIILSIFAILLLIPADPFTHRYTTVGVVLLVLDTVAIAVGVCEYHLWCCHYGYAPNQHYALQSANPGPTVNNVAGNAV